jgi:hypothetical protein
MVEKIHGVLVENDWGSILPYDGIGFFLETCCETLGTAEWHNDVAAVEVKRALEVVRRHNKWKSN